MESIRHEGNLLFNDTYPGVSVSVQSSPNPGAILSPHWHERMEIWYIKKGQLTVTCDDEIFDAGEEDVVIINPGQVHSFKVLTTPCQYHCYIVDTTPFLHGPFGANRSIRDIAAGTIRFQHIVRNHISVKEVLTQISAAENEKADGLLVGGLIMQLFACLLSHCIANRSFQHHSQLQDINKLLAYIHHHYREDLQLEQLAAVACLSPTYLCRRFKNAVGESPMAYLTTVRINKAYELLSTGNYSVAQACAAVGIADCNNFTRLFRKRVGFPPKDAKPTAGTGKRF